MADDLPYRAEYAKSGRASCKGCKGNIAKDTLRLAVMIQSPMFDGKVPNWYHQMCFFGKQRPKTVADISHYDSLRWEDQEKIKTQIETLGSAPVPTKGGKGRKKGVPGLGDYVVEYAKSSRAKCRQCEDKIEKGEIRMSKKEYDSDSAKKYGPVDQWHHVKCFIERREEFEFFDSAENIPGYNTLSGDDKNTLKSQIKKIESKPKADGKRKAEDETDSIVKKVKTEEEEIVRKQSKRMYKYRDMLSSFKKKELGFLIEHNDQYMPAGDSSMLDLIVDGMTFGALDPCKVCSDGRFKYEYGKGYICKGNLTEWTKCMNVQKEPSRRKFRIPEEMKAQFDFLAKYKFPGVSKRVWVDHGPSSVAVKQQNGSGMSSSSKPLSDMQFIIVGDKFSKDKKEMRDTIRRLGGEVVSSVSLNVAAVITTSDEVTKLTKNIIKAKDLNIQCVSEDFLDEVEKGGALLMIQKKNIAPWGSDPQDRVHASKSSKASKSESKYTKSIPEKQKIKLKGGAAVDPDSGLEDSAHVYQRGNKIYNCVLGMVDIARGTNSYYKLQILESDKKNSWYVFRSWGRIGTTIGNNKLENKEDLNDALAQFNFLYEDKTGNQFNAEYKKLPGYWYPLDIDYGQDEDAVKKPISTGSKSKLAKAIQDLVSLIFDVDTMKSALVEFEIDTKKMPLGKLSKKQMASAYKVLSEALKFIKDVADESGESDAAAATKARLIDCSNRFYTLIPHDFGMRQPTILDSIDLINTKIAMLDNLSEIEVAYNLLKSEGDEEDKNADPIDKHYNKLKTKMEVLDHVSDEFKMIQKYVKNTHASTHSHYELILDDVFKVERKGERKRFKPFKKLHNRQLLWHGSRLTNYAGILSQGLRIAPPEAPVTGYMFGKGVYFADMVSKSANYCSTSSSNPTGIMLLSEVALGNMYERTGAEYVEKLPKGMHSTKGLGRTCPDPAETIKIEGDIEVPLGKGVSADGSRTSLLYNEYIVYDVAQINIKYLLRLRFKYKY